MKLRELAESIGEYLRALDTSSCIAEDYAPRREEGVIGVLLYSCHLNQTVRERAPEIFIVVIEGVEDGNRVTKYLTTESLSGAFNHFNKTVASWQN